jgi:nucleotide-binding universal stress UspA family protein
MPFTRILCAVDFSPQSLEAFRVAAEMARLHSGSLHVLHVMDAQAHVSGEALIRIVETANEAMEKLVATSQSSLNDVALTTEVSSGAAAAEIANRAREWRADLIVLGSKGITSLEEIIVGGTAERVVKESPCSVLVVRGRP